jgi:hypothetical protein
MLALRRMPIHFNIRVWLQRLRKRKRAAQNRVSLQQILKSRNADRR